MPVQKEAKANLSHRLWMYVLRQELWEGITLQSFWDEGEINQMVNPFRMLTLTHSSL